ncbi:helix-turn-helix domain-containing protein [Nesterenkonia muleiensis]|uniref:helix-turn-helix domain-containing protein n=1 Tax=Nesterenkonia muleiensis TaxID=2282648 RepID=UPI000E718AD6|nr:helix-turn-helix domain-containing protein [Nesterenkonia muleiensis]
MTVAAQATENPAAWDRCRRAGLSREITGPRHVSPASEIEERRRRSPLSAVAAPVRDALVRATSHDHVLILTDARGSVITRHGTAAALGAAERIGFDEGADWSETSVGTNAISEALRLSGAAYVSGEGHFAYSHADWTCMAAPVYHPNGGDLLGVLDVSGPRAQLGQDVIGMVRMTALLAEEMLRIVVPDVQDPAEMVRLRLLGAQPAVRIGGGPWRKLPPRTAEILAVLSSRARGFTSTELASELYGDDGRPGTVRSEMHRLRKRLGPIISSEPYRFAEGLRTVSDVHDVEEALVREEVDTLLRHYTQPLLPASAGEHLVRWRASLDNRANQLLADFGSTSQRAQWAQTEMAWQQQV